MGTKNLLSKRFLVAAGLISGLCVLMFVVRILTTGTSRYYFIPENLILAWMALVFSWLLVTQLRKRRWLSWQNIGLSLIWLFFLPNSWYVLTDFLHVYATGEISPIYDITMIFSLVVSGFMVGFASLYLVHLDILKRKPARTAHFAIGAILVISSFGIYLGRDLRWNTWDLITHPEGLILNVSDRVVDPFSYPRAITVTILFSALLSVIYISLWILTGPHKVRRA